MASETDDGRQVFLSTVPAGPGDQRRALAVGVVSLVVFATVAPFAKMPLAKVWAFIPIYESALATNDLITTVLLLGQFTILRSRALLVLAAGYFFTALMTVAHALTFPELFAPTGLLGAGPQSTAWLYMFWHGGFPLFVIAYARLGDRQTRERSPRAAAWTLGAVGVAVIGFTALATAGQGALPAIMSGNRYTPAMLAVVSSTWALSLVALVLLRRQRTKTVLDLWLMMVMVAWLFDIALAAVLNAGRFDLGFYAGRIYGLLAASFVLAMLLLENARLYARLVESNARAEAANQAKSDFLSRMSHELRTPLNAVLGFGQLLGRRAEDPRDRESVEQILKGGRHLLSLINEVLDLARIESGRLALSPEPVQVAEAVNRTLDLARPLAAERRIALRVDAAGTGARYVMADAQRLHQVLLNLVANAIKYNRDGGDVTVGCTDAGAGRLRFEIADTGAGIPADLRARLFTAFDRLGAETGTVEGTGLGLVVAKRLVEAMGGVIGVESVEGQGSTFWIELREAASPEERLRQRATATASTAATQGTVLYIEDNAANVRLVEAILTERPAIRVIAATHGRLGLDLARRHRPTMILADLHLADISGEDVLREVRADAVLRDTPVIILSADATPGQISRLLAAGARAYLTKPLDVQELLAKVDTWCNASGSA